MFLVDPESNNAGYTGCQPRPMKVGANPRFPVWGTVDECPILPRSEWKTVSLRHKVWEVVNQSSQNTCACASTRGAMEILREVYGLKRERLSHGSTYSMVNGGRDQGANIMDVLEAMMDVGMAPMSLIDQYDISGRYPSTWKVTAAKFKILEAWDCPSFDAIISAIQKGNPVVLGVTWGTGAHAICGTGYDKETNTLEFLNSYGIDWGDMGFGNLTEKQVRSVSTYGAFAIRSVTIPSDEVLPPAPK